MLSKEEQEQFSKIFEELGKTLDISETQFNAAVASYQAVGNQLTKEGSALAIYQPEILPQGSFMLGTMIKPISEEDDIDIDLVCNLHGKNPFWTQQKLKEEVGKQLAENMVYKDMMEDKRRCWTLTYRKDSPNLKERYHMDILPSIVNSNYKITLERELKMALDMSTTKQLEICITDNQTNNYRTETDHQKWLLTNPFGYGKWFFDRAINNSDLYKELSRAIRPVPEYSNKKLVLQRVVQILKRHRDIIWYNRTDKDDKPISIIITTLAAKAYKKEQNLMETLLNVVERMGNEIEEKYSIQHGDYIKWIANPVNDKENFADKWPDNPRKEDNFYDWLKAVKLDLNKIIAKKGLGLPDIGEAMSQPFGKDLVKNAFTSYGELSLLSRTDGNMKMAASTGILSSVGRTIVPAHQPFGANE
ncbi:hypothetical protein SAMN06298216_1685 [Spirosomataceae bacterium TFI 002]|nr:hypothetical protein SAMN06298216_1685 [Spirosomataceae bacterium TFI 002]